MSVRRNRFACGAQMEIETIGDGPLRVAMIHGAMSSRRMFDGLRDRLHAQRPGALSTIGIDLPGFGGSPAPARGYDYPTQAGRIASALRADPQPTVVVGHSMGGGIALTLLLDAPDIVDGLVLIGAGLGRAEGGGSIAAYGRPQLEADLLARYVEGWLVEPRPERVAALVEDAMRMTPASFDCVRKAIAEYDLSGAAKRFMAMELPVLVVRGAQDRTRTDGEAAALAGVFRHAVRLNVQGAGHCPHLEMPDAVADGILQWLDRPTAGRDRAGV